jgi:hypothetical protein
VAVTDGPFCHNAPVRTGVLAAALLTQLSTLVFHAQQPPVSVRFEPVPGMSATSSFTNAWADFDLDGDLDLFVGFGATVSRLYRNDRGTMTEVGAGVDLSFANPTRAAAWGDYDADGDPDLLVGFAGGGSVLRLFRNDRGRFVQVTAEAGLTIDKGAVRQLVWIDPDGDGDLDLFVAFRDRPNAFFRNDDRQFTDIAAEIGLADPRRSVGAVWFDYDEDGDLDVYVGNMDGDANGLFRNGGGRFADVADAAGLAWGGRQPKDPTNGTVRPCVADVNGDGRLDLFTANYGRNGLFLARGQGRFEDVSEAWGIAIDARYDTCAFADIDHDGRIDLYVNGTVTGGVNYQDYLFRNTGTRFEDVTPENLRAIPGDHGAAWADFDRDGDLDLALTGVGDQPMPLLMRNLLPQPEARRSLLARVVDERGRSVRAGAEVFLGVKDGSRPIASRIMDSGSGYNAQNDMPVHFGLPSNDVCLGASFALAGKRISVPCAPIDTYDRRDGVVIVTLRLK